MHDHAHLVVLLYAGPTSAQQESASSYMAAQATWYHSICFWQMPTTVVGCVLLQWFLVSLIDPVLLV